VLRVQLVFSTCVEPLCCSSQSNLRVCPTRTLSSGGGSFGLSVLSLASSRGALAAWRSHLLPAAAAAARRRAPAAAAMCEWARSARTPVSPSLMPCGSATVSPPPANACAARADGCSVLATRNSTCRRRHPPPLTPPRPPRRHAYRSAGPPDAAILHERHCGRLLRHLDSLDRLLEEEDAIQRRGDERGGAAAGVLGWAVLRSLLLCLLASLCPADGKPI
jgi:hypothetical protein